MTINIQTEYTSPVDPLWNMIDKLAPGHVVFVRGKRDDLIKIEQKAFLMPLKDHLVFRDPLDFDRVPLPAEEVVLKSGPKIRDFCHGVVAFDIDTAASKIWRVIVDINRSNVYVFFERDEYLDTPSVSIR